MSDAAWPTGPDCSSQGGYCAILPQQTAFSDKEVEYAVLDWHSDKLARVARSRLNAEKQAAADAADALEYMKVFWN